MRLWKLPVILGFVGLAGCGSAEPGFRIDDVSVRPDDIPVNISTNAPLVVGASVFNDRHAVVDAWVNSDEGQLWIDLNPRDDPRWTGEIPLSSLIGFPAGDYYLDFHAVDLAGRQVVLDDAVRLRIRDE